MSSLMQAQPWDTLITGALVFDGSGAAPERLDVAIADGKVVACAAGLPHANAREVLHREGHWLMPGLIDIHTHLDLEVELAPGLSEVVRHGTTTVVVGNCSLGAAFGAQRSPGQDPIVDCFARVENIPKHVLSRCADRMDWDNSADYLKHLGSIALGPNMVPLVPHSMLRIQVMGLEDSIRREPTPTELARMQQLLQDAIDQGYVGFSTDGLPFHYLANDPHRDRRIPTQFASFGELKALTGILRAADRVWQVTPMPDRPLETLRNYLLSSARLHGKALRVTALAAVEFAANPRGSRALLGMTRLVNSRFFGGNMHLQALSAPFTIWADGVTNPIMEEMPSTRALMALDLDDREGRARLMADPAWMAQFRHDWYRGRRGFDGARLRALIGMPLDNFSRELADVVVDRCPVEAWCGASLAAAHARLLAFQAGDARVARTGQERDFFEACPRSVNDEAAFFIHLLQGWDKSLRWHTVIANRDPRRLRELLFDPNTLPGFNDSGAHLSNLAFYDGNLLTLKIAAEEGMGRVAEAVRRLTRAPAEFFGIDAGSLAPGARADITVVDPVALARYDSDRSRQLIWRDELQAEQLVNRSDGVVSDVFIAGRAAWQKGAVTPALGRERMGSALGFTGRSA
jgi:N-acyl-D-aspartate/D-glutamate deacylase